MYHSCNTFPWFGIHITPSLIIFSSFLLDHAFILLYLADSLSWILLIGNISIFSSNLSSRFSTMFSYSSGKLDIMWVIIYTSSIMTPNFCKSPLNNYSSVIQSYGSLVTSSNSHFANFFRSIVLDTTVIGWNFMFNFFHTRKAHPLGNSLVANSSTIWKHTVSSCAKIRSFTRSCLVAWLYCLI